MGRLLSFLYWLTEMQKEGTSEASGGIGFALGLQCERRPGWMEMAALVEVRMSQRWLGRFVPRVSWAWVSPFLRT